MARACVALLLALGLTGCTLVLDLDGRRVVGGDASIDAGPPPPFGGPILRGPFNGYATGTSRISLDIEDPPARHPLRPVFRWDEIPEAVGYQIEIQSCPNGTPPDSCAFDRPIRRPATAPPFSFPDGDISVATGPGVHGTRYIWRVRGVDAEDMAGGWSDVWYLDIGRQPTDVDGDGFADLLVGAPGFGEGTTSTGAIALYRQRMGSLLRAEASTAHRAMPPSASPAERFGHSVSFVGDLNADGCADLVVGTPNITASGGSDDSGKAFVWYGDPEVTDILGSQSPVPLEALVAAAGDLFGASVSGAGDVDGDGYSDFLVGAPGVDGGLAYLFFGGPTEQRISGLILLLPPPGGSDGCFGDAVAGGADLNGDGFTDMVVGDPCVYGEMGAVHVFLGGPESSLMVEGIVPTQTLRGSGGRFGQSVSIGGDVNGDFLADLVVGAPASALGAAFLYLGALSTDTPLLDSGTATIEHPGSVARFGEAVAIVGDYDGDGEDEVLIGAPGPLPTATPTAGIAILYYRSGDGLLSFMDEPRLGIDSGLSIERLGASVAGLGDVNGDGLTDVAIAAPYGESTGTELNEGQVWLFFGATAGGLTAGGIPDLYVDTPWEMAQRERGLFGSALGGAF